MNTQSHSFSTKNGTSCTVWNEHGVATNANGWMGRTAATRTWVQNNVTGQRRDVQPGCAFQASGAARRAGW